MAAYSVVRSAHKTLVAATVDTVTLSSNPGTVLVTSRGADDIFFTLGLNGGVAVAPASSADDTFVALANGAKEITPEGVVTSVKLISATGIKYSVEGL